ncbi:MAG: T9SS type A sorting domain-containing protein [Bacteroidota bacterium]|nr:T9SS type A sorting domain-containing protein [Bacteroidota bacterium]MDX5504558.1 T9SS type A sorting domain-containing protein [Bacteroidota bacterium]
MKNRLLVAGFLGMIGAGVAGTAWLGSSSTAEAQYTPRMEASAEAGGMIDYLHLLRQDPTTGEIPIDAVQAARQAVLGREGGAASLSLEWQELGPDNFGGRTRAILIDRNNRNKLFAAGVSGGLFVSNDAGRTWTVVNDQLDNLAIVSITQTTNGTLYAGTGEGAFYFTSGNGSGGISGGGVFRSTDGGVTWNLLSSTVPTGAGTMWASVSSLGSDPSAPDRVYAGTGAGIRVSEDGGQTWTNPITAGGGVGTTTDLSVGTDGSVWVNVGARLWYSPDGSVGSFVEKTSTTGGGLPTNGARMKAVVAPSDPDIVYVAQVGSGSSLRAVYRTTDRGDNWTTIGTKTTYFDPLCSSAQCQGNYDLLLGVNPNDPDHILFGGVQLWEWKLNGGWRQAASTFQGATNPFYVHVDHHALAWDGVNNKIYAGNDGGVFMSADNAFTWTHLNKGYNTIQFYSVDVASDLRVLGGTQDNSNHYIDYKGNTRKSSQELYSGDGGYTEISWLNPNAIFLESQYGNMARAELNTLNYQSFFHPRMFEAGRPGQSAFAPFVTPFLLHETTEDMESWDSTRFVNTGAIRSLGFGDGIKRNYLGTLSKPQPSGQFLASTFKVVAGGDTILSDASGNLSGDGTGTFDPATGAYDVTFNTAPFAEIVLTSSIQYSVGDSLIVQSRIENLPIRYQLASPLAPGDSVEIQDPIQATFFIGLTSYNGTQGGIWMTRRPLDLLNTTPQWWNIAVLGNGEAVSAMEITPDGDVLYVGTAAGRVFRISNLNEARSLSTADVDSINTYILEVSLIATWTNRFVTSLAVDPNNNDRVIATLGNYGPSSHVYYSSNATTASPSFQLKQGDLPSMPVYASTFDINNPNNIIIGTDLGVFTTDDISAASPSWTQDNNGLANVPVFMLKQYRAWYGSNADFNRDQGQIFAATHGRGFFRTNTLVAPAPLSDGNDPVATKDIEKGLMVYPNPARDFTQVDVELGTRSNVTVNVRDIQGRMVKSIKFKGMDAGKHSLNLSTTDLSNGTYVITVIAGNSAETGKLMVVK